MTSKTIFICFLLFSSCRIIESASLSESDSSNSHANDVAVEIDSTSTRGTFNNSGTDGQDLANVEEVVAVETPEKVEEKAIEFRIEADKADSQAATIEVASAIPDDIVVSKRPTPAVITIPAKEPASKKKFVLVAVLGTILLGAVFFWKRINQVKSLIDLDRKAIDMMDTYQLINPPRFDGGRAALLQEILKWNQYYKIPENTLEAIEAQMASQYAPYRENIIKELKAIIEKEKYDVDDPNAIARLLAARQYYFEQKIIPTLDRTNEAIVTLIRDTALRILYDLENSFGVNLSDFKAGFNAMTGFKAVPYADIATQVAPLARAIEGKESHPDYEKAKFFVENIHDLYLKLFPMNSAIPVFKEKRNELLGLIKLNDQALLEKLTSKHNEVKAKK